MKNTINEICDKVIIKADPDNPKDISREIVERENFMKELLPYFRRAEFYKRLAFEYLKSKYPKTSQIVPDELIDLILKAKPEIAKIWEAIKAKVTVTGSPPDREKNMMDAALERFGDSIKGFKIIKEEHLKDTKIYVTNSIQGKRDFEEAILKKIAQSNGYKGFGGRLLRTILQQAENLLTDKQLMVSHNVGVKPVSSKDKLVNLLLVAFEFTCFDFLQRHRPPVPGRFEQSHAKSKIFVSLHPGHLRHDTFSYHVSEMFQFHRKTVGNT